MFDYIKSEGFRSFKEVDLKLGPLSVLIGPNNGGKSNLLDLMLLMTEAAQGQLEKGINSRGGFLSISHAFNLFGNIRLEFRFQDESLRRVFPWYIGGEGKRNVRFKLALRFVPMTPVISEEEITEDPPQPERSLVVVERNSDECAFTSVEESGLRVEEQKALESRSELAIFQVKDLGKYPTPYRLLSQFGEWVVYRGFDTRPESAIRLPGMVRPTLRLSADGANLPSVLNSIQQRHPDLWDEIIETLRVANPSFKTITFPPEGGDGKVVLRWWEKPFDRYGISANFLSDGTLKFLCLIAILKSPDPPPLVCIDEPEVGLHPDWIKLLAELLQDAATRTQVLVATHSPQIVAKLDPEQVIVAEKVEGATGLKRLERSGLEAWLKDFNLSELWLAGHFGGRP